MSRRTSAWHSGSSVALAVRSMTANLQATHRSRHPAADRIMIVKDLPPISCFSYMEGKAFAIVRPHRRNIS
jgi:hypothetical protein